jgi:inosine-uridine nucleoside N-ribohydrolase
MSLKLRPGNAMVSIATVLIILWSPRTTTAAQLTPPFKVPILLDTDLGSDIDDAFALALVLASPELDLRGITTVGTGAEDRAWMACRLLTAAGRKDIPVAWGRSPQPEEKIDGQIQYRRHPAVIFNRTARPVKEAAVDFLYQQVKAHPGKLTLLGIGPLTNIARLLTEHPDCKPWIKKIVVMGGSVRVGYAGKSAPEAEWNIKADIKAAQTVFHSGIPLVVAPLDATATLELDDSLRQTLFKACTPLTYQVQALYQLWDKSRVVLYDPVAVALCFNESFCEMEDLKLEVDGSGFTRVVNRKANCRVATSIRREPFLKWYVARVASGQAVLPKPPPNPARLMPSDSMPLRVHAFEDFETDIEKRWWMSGKAETVNVPSGSKRSCRGVLTQDFDDLMGDLKTMYTAVIFNPVPGPPMGKQPRLRFRYWLKGTDTLRIQIYSLTRGYHRCLTLTGLPQSRWESATVDMREVRRPDGSGGPLEEHERIDDIQFYVDPRAELLIDDIVLYEAAAPAERRPFPSRLLYTGWFDTGKQGKEWPGTFEIVDKRGYFWRAARSVPREGGDSSWIQLKLRGKRPAGAATELFFRYHLAGADAMKVILLNPTTGAQHSVTLTSLEQGRWVEATVNFTRDGGGQDRPAMSRRDDEFDEIRFFLARGAELLLDDVLLYAPGK